jgi:hypothetical protein
VAAAVAALVTGMLAMQAILPSDISSVGREIGHR